MEKLAEANPLFFQLVNDAWMSKVHNRNGPNFKDIDQILDSRTSSNFTMDHMVLQKEVLELVQTNNMYYNKGDRRRLFPGPMAAQLSRKHTSFIQKNDYFITEKSDGTRAMFYCRFIDRFPRWQLRLDEKRKREFSVTENAILEAISIRFQLNVNRDLHDFEYIDNGKIVKARIQRIKSNQNNISLSLITDTVPPKRYPLIRLKGLFICYLFDRTFKFYLLKESGYVFPSCSYPKLVKANPRSEVRIQRTILLDGEIVPCFQTNMSLNYAVFDIICFGEQRKCVNDQGMGEKVKMIKAVLDSHHFYYKYFRILRPHALTLVCKHFYKKKQVRDVLRVIEHVEGKGYVYKGYNKNDGLVFTPTDVAHYHFTPGPCYKLLKWKWTDKNTSDFMIRIMRTNDRNSDVDEYFELHYGVTKKSKKTNLYQKIKELPGVTEEARFRARKYGFFIGELFFRRDSRDWELRCVREDKVFPNTFLSVCSVLSSQIEDISKEELVDIVLQAERGKNIDEDFERVMIEKNDVLNLKLVFVKKNRKKPILMVGHSQSRDQMTCFTIVDDCVHEVRNDEGLLKFQGNELVRYVSEKFYNQIIDGKQAVYCRCVFLPSSGIYKIIDFEGSASRCFGHTILKSMENMCVRSMSLRSKKRKRKDEEEEEEEEGEEERRNNIGTPMSMPVAPPAQAVYFTTEQQVPQPPTPPSQQQQQSQPQQRPRNPFQRSGNPFQRNNIGRKQQQQQQQRNNNRSVVEEDEDDFDDLGLQSDFGNPPPHKKRKLD